MACQDTLLAFASRVERTPSGYGPSPCGVATSRSPEARRPTCARSSTATARGWPPAPACTSSTAPPPVAWFPWLATQVDWPTEPRVLEVGVRRRLDVGRGGGPPPRRPRPDAHRRVAGHGRRGARPRRLARSLPAHHRPRGRRAGPAVPRRGPSTSSWPTTCCTTCPTPAAPSARWRGSCGPGGTLVVACVGDGHLTELHQIRREVFGDLAADAFGSSFGATAGAEVLPAWFGEVRWQPYRRRPRLSRSRRRGRVPRVDAAGRGGRARPSAAASSPPCASASPPAAGACGSARTPGLFVCRRPPRRLTPSGRVAAARRRGRCPSDTALGSTRVRLRSGRQPGDERVASAQAQLASSSAATGPSPSGPAGSGRSGSGSRGSARTGSPCHRRPARSTARTAGRRSRGRPE